MSGDADAELSAFAEPEGSEPLALVPLDDGLAPSRVSSSRLDGRTEVKAERAHAYRLPDGLEYHGSVTNAFSIADDEPLSASARSEHEIAIGRDGWQTHVRARARVTCDATTFVVHTELTASENDKPVLSRDWSFEIPRDHV
jgi:hypothetical protein